MHQGYLEPQVCLVDIEPLGDLTVYTSTQAAFYCRTRVAETVDLPTQRINVVPMPVGGGFGGKFVLIEPMVAAAALAVGRPVLLHYSRMDDFLAGNPAPDCRISVKLGATRAGDITALESRLVFDTGSSGGSPLADRGDSARRLLPIPEPGDSRARSPDQQTGCRRLSGTGRAAGDVRHRVRGRRAGAEARSRSARVSAPQLRRRR